MREERKLQRGFTTGTCAAAAVKAAAQMLFFGGRDGGVSVMTPAGERAFFDLEVLEGGEAPACGSIRCAVKKDAGDDPDVTDGALVFARVSRVRRLPAGLPCYREESGLPLFLTGGEGIGVVTRKGLSCPVGYHAINPVPRRMIFSEAERVWRRFGRPDEMLLIEISIPAGEELAKKTFNPKLGIVGGISVLGTTGIVNPMSEEALVETIRLDIRVRAACGRRMLAAAPGSYGETFLRDRLGISMDSFVKCSNFIGDSFRMMAEEGIVRALLAGHLGKLIKVAGGVLNTHSRFGDRRMEILSDCAGEAGAPGRVREALLSLNTAEEAAEYLESEGNLPAVMAVAAARVQRVLERHCGIRVEVVLFTERYGILAMTGRAMEWARELGSANRRTPEQTGRAAGKMRGKYTDEQGD